MTRRQLLKAAAAATGLIVGGALLNACAAGSPASPTAKPVGGAPAPQATAAQGQGAAPLKIGVLLPYSKVYAQLGESITDGMNLYLESAGNSAGGRKIVLIKEDEENDPQVSLRKARKFIESDNVDLITGIVSSAVALAVRDLVHSTKTLLVISNAGANDLTRGRKSPYIFRTSFSNWQSSWAMGAWVAKNVSKRVFCSAPNYAAGKEMVEAFKETFLPAGGEVVGELFPPLGNTDYGPFLTQIAQAKPGATFNFYSGSDALNFVQQYEQFGLKKNIPLTGPGFLVEQDVLPAQGKAALGTYTALYWAITLDNPENKKFVADFQAKYKRKADAFAMQGYDTARVIVETLNQAQGQTDDKDRLIKIMEGVKFNSPRGPFAFDPETHNVVQDVYIRKVEEVNGELVNVVLETVKAVRDPGK